jgi:hypothetical protein
MPVTLPIMVQTVNAIPLVQMAHAQTRNTPWSEGVPRVRMTPAIV